MIIELFSGIGRFQTDETVIYISNDIKTKPTICADVRYLPIKKETKVNLVHGSPPCRYISKAKAWATGYNFKGIADTFRLYASFFDAVDYLKPDYITFESPGNIEFFLKKMVFHHPKYDIKNSTTNLYYSSKKQMKRAELNENVRTFMLGLL